MDVRKMNMAAGCDRQWWMRHYLSPAAASFHYTRVSILQSMPRRQRRHWIAVQNSAASSTGKTLPCCVDTQSGNNGKSAGATLLIIQLPYMDSYKPTYSGQSAESA